MVAATVVVGAQVTAEPGQIAGGGLGVEQSNMVVATAQLPMYVSDNVPFIPGPADV